MGGVLKHIKKLIGAEELIKRIPRYVLWLVDVELSEIRKYPKIVKRVEAVREFRLKSKRKQTRELANTPYLFENTRNPNTALVIPCVSSSKREYIPMAFIDNETIVLNTNTMIPNAEPYYFAILISKVHMVWMKNVCGRFGDGYRYSKDVVYNNFLFPKLNKDSIKLLNDSANHILEIRTKYPNSTLEDLYDPLFMPNDLRKAHMENDKLVLKLYGIDANASEEEIFDRLVDRYVRFIR